MIRHEVDLPITNLDENEDDFTNPVVGDEDLDAAVLRDDFDMDEPTTFKKHSLFTKFKEWGSKLTSGAYSRAPNNLHMSGIELSEGQFNDNDAFDLSDNEFTLKRQTEFLFATSSDFIKRFTRNVLILLFLVTVIILTSILSNNKSSKFKEQPFHKATLSNGTHSFYPTTVLISLDGFHPHYISEALTPTLHNFLVKGYGAPYLIPSFPSSTFPNHWTIATGLYPQDHGIVGNTFYDPVLGQFINVIPERSLITEFWGGEPIWSTAEKNGVRSAIHMFPGSEVHFDKFNAHELDPYNGTETLEVKTKRIIEWLNRDVAERPELIMAYVPTIDLLGHKYGIKGKEIEEGLKNVDEFISSLVTGLADRNLTDIVNLIIVSDHGMAPTSEDRLIYLDNLLDSTKIQKIDGWPLYGLRPFEKYSVEEVFQELKDSFKSSSGYNIYLKEDLPKEFKFGGDKCTKYSDRIAPIWVIPDVGYSITTHDDMERKGGIYSPKGVHGYNNSEVLMRAIFLGDGPYFKSKAGNENASYKIKPFKNLEVYNILCDTLNLPPAPNNGSTNFINSDNFLVDDWKDPTSYPDVDFSLNILNFDPSYDKLFRVQQDRHTTTLENTKDSGSTLKTGAKANSKIIAAEESKLTPKRSISHTMTNTLTTSTEASNSSHKGKHKSIWGFIEDTAHDIGENLKELGEDIKEGLEEFLESTEDAVEDIHGTMKEGIYDD